ncbi:MAG: permease prefix domain 1-containing protein [Candidatus Izemoplasmatales bacterium]|nr:permease prefix domain 1-containing protein [Candidatus Izemoplasmatales bacterium]
MNQIKRFVSNLLRDLFNEEDKKELIEILTLSLEEKVEDLVEQGATVEDAIQTSIREFGGKEDILSAFPDQEKQRLKAIKLRKNQFLFSLFGYLLIVGMALFFNLTFFDFFGRKLWFFVIVIAVFFWPLVMLYRYLILKK